MKITVLVFFAIITLFTNTSFAEEKDKEVSLETEKPKNHPPSTKFYKTTATEATTKYEISPEEVIKQPTKTHTYYQTQSSSTSTNSPNHDALPLKHEKSQEKLQGPVLKLDKAIQQEMLYTNLKSSLKK